MNPNDETSFAWLRLLIGVAAGAAVFLGHHAPARAETYVRVPRAAISGHNHKQLSNVSVAQCKAACTSENSFTCKSFDYHRTSRKCDLSSQSASLVGLKTDYENNPYDHYARTNGYAYFRSAAISGYNDKQLSNVTPAQCMAACSSEASFTCRSFDYHKLTGKCDLSSKTARDVGGLKTDYSSPRYDHFAREIEPGPEPPLVPVPAAIVPWDGNPLPDGAKIAMRVSVRRDLPYGGGLESFGPAWVRARRIQTFPTNPWRDFLIVKGSELSMDAVLTVTTIPRAQGETLSGNFPSQYQKMIIRADNGNYVLSHSTGYLTVETPKADSYIMLLDLTHGTTAGFYFSGYQYKNAHVLAEVKAKATPTGFIVDGDYTYILMKSPGGGLSEGCFFELFIVEFD